MKDKFVKIRCTEEEKNALFSFAKESGMNFSEYVFETLNRYRWHDADEFPENEDEYVLCLGHRGGLYLGKEMERNEKGKAVAYNQCGVVRDVKKWMQLPKEEEK